MKEHEIEARLNVFIEELFQHLKDLHPKDGLSSPRDIQLAHEINKKARIMDHMQDAMRVINPHYEIRR